ncbi:hypothetical protein GCM10010313_06290 [Streptomyces violarus]|nr:hypothetical protein GCM10010313_06290 [Streptomyces violarus]
MTETLGLLRVVAVTAANIGARKAAAGLLTRLRSLQRDLTSRHQPTAVTPAALSAGAGRSSSGVVLPSFRAQLLDELALALLHHPSPTSSPHPASAPVSTGSW